MIDKGNFIDNFNDECVSFIMGIGNNINVYIVEVFTKVFIITILIKIKILRIMKF